MNDDFPQRIDFAQARDIIARVTAGRRLPAAPVALARALGGVLAEPVDATAPLPGFDNAAMDGFALRGEDAAAATGDGLRLVGEQFAGGDRAARIGPGECVRITTGAPLPAGADTIVVKENVAVRDGRVVALVEPVAGAHVRHAGEDVRPGDRVLEAGVRLQPLLARWRATALAEAADAALVAGDASARALVDALCLARVSIAPIRLRNLNTPADLHEARR